MVLTAFAPAAASAQTAEAPTDLAIDVTQDPETGNATVTVTNGTEALSSEQVNVTSTEPYAGNGTYETDANGTVTLAEPEETLNVTANVTSGDLEATATAEVEDIDTGFVVAVEQNSDGSAVVTVTDDGDAVENATVNVTSDVAYEGNGTYNTSESGTVDLPAPEQNVTIDVVANNGTDEANVTTELTVVENGGYANFGHWVTGYIDQLRNEGYFGKEFGQAVSSFATQNNPGAENKPDHAGPKDDDDDERAAATNATDDDQGPPEHAQNDKGDEDAESNDGDEQGPPEHAQNDKGDEDAETDDEEATSESTEETDCSVDGDDECDDETADDEEAAGDDDEGGDDAPGKSGSKGNGGGNGPKK
jgi:hypothetical protein